MTPRPAVVARAMRRRVRGTQLVRSDRSERTPAVVLGPAWFQRLVGPDVTAPASSGPAVVLVGPDVSDGEVTATRERWPDVPVVGYRHDSVPGPTDPVVQPWLSNPWRCIVPVDLPADLRALAETATWGAPAARQPSDLPVALQRADLRRRALASSVRSVLLGADADGRDVTVVLVTNRPALLQNALDNVRRQTLRPRLVLVTNATGFDQDAIGEVCAELPGSVHLDVPADRTLGECLGRGLEVVETRYVAKFDDDDWYGPHHLADETAALGWSGAGVVGKHSYLAHLARTDRTILRHPGRSFAPVGFVAGGTIVFDRQRVGTASFPHRNTGEDSGFLRACEHAGAIVLSTDWTGYVQHRGTDNTWEVSDDRFAVGSVDLGRGHPGV